MRTNPTQVIVPTPFFKADVDLGKTNVACSSATDFNDCVGFGYRGDFSNALKLGLVGLNFKF